MTTNRPDDADRINEILEQRDKHAARTDVERDDHISERECQRMNHLDAQNHTNREIGERVGWSHRTVSHHINDHCSHDTTTVDESTGGEIDG